MSMEVHFSSKKMDWTTPKEFYNLYNAIYKFNTDLACTSINCLAPRGMYYDKGIDSLSENWEKLKGWSWCNPPYGRELKLWVRKAYESSLKGANIIMLIPSRTDTSYWHDYIFNKENVEVDFIRGRLKFGEGKNSAPFPSAVIKFKGVKDDLSIETGNK